MISPVYYIALIACVACSAFFSASEMSMSSCNRLRLENLRDEGSARARLAVKVLDRFDDSLSAILIGNNLANLGGSSLASVVVILLFGDEWTWLSTVAMTVIVIVCGETVPKIFAKKNSNRTILACAPLVRGVTVILGPVVFLVVGAVRLITKPMKGEPDASQEQAVEELQSIIETAEDEDVLDEDRSELLQAALDFSDISAAEAMTSRVDMVALDIDDDMSDILNVIDSAPYSRLPVYEESIDNIIGVLHLNGFFRQLADGGQVELRPLLMEPCFVYKTTKLPAVLAELRRRQTHLAIVTDEYGGTLGVVTMEDVLEELVGDIWDETDEYDPEYVEKENGAFQVDGDMTIGDLAELLDMEEDDFHSESETVGGWTTERFGAFPAAGDSFDFADLRVTVQDMDGLRVEKVLVQRLPKDTDDA